MRRRPATTSTTSRSPARSARIGREGERPLPPLNLVGDFGGGGMLLALRRRRRARSRRARSGEGQVVDAAMVDGAALLMTMIHALRAHRASGTTSRAPTCSTPARHFYDVYETRRRRYVSRRRDRAAVLRRAARGCSELDPARRSPQMDQARWPELKERVRRGLPDQDPRRVGGDPRAHRRLLAPVLTMGEAPSTRTTSPAARSSRSTASVQPAPAPRFSRTPSSILPTPRPSRARTPRRPSPPGA